MPWKNKETCFPNVSRSKICFCYMTEAYFASGKIASRMAQLGKHIRMLRMLLDTLFPGFAGP